MHNNANSVLWPLLKKAMEDEFACILLSNGFQDDNGKYEIVAGFGAKEVYTTLESLKTDCLQFGFFSYDLKNKIEHLKSENPAWIPVPDIFFFEPISYYKQKCDGTVETNIELKPESYDSRPLHVYSGSEMIWEKPDVNDYIKTVNDIREAIREGVFYELNYCTQWSAENVRDFDPYISFFRLNEISPAPFAAFFKWKDKFLLCTSPERFLQTNNGNIISQPIKGTRKRLEDPHQDSLLRTELMTSEKDRAENVMITDLVRNDISRFCIPGTVEVAELCGIHSFKHVHQMISTITGKMKENTSVETIIRSAFPMGSMTGAPKIKVMECSENYENFRRGWYSGSVGYLEPGGMDLNVVIRSLQFDAGASRIAYHVGGAITYDSIAEIEFQECMDKAAGILSLFKRN